MAILVYSEAVHPITYCDPCLTESFQPDRDPPERGSRPLNSNR